MSEYKRLTRKDQKGRWIADANHFGLYIDTTGQTRYGDVEVVYGDVINRLAELENKIESGELVELPKKEFLGKNGIGENIYAVTTTTFRLFCEEQQADDFLLEQKTRMLKRESQ